MLKRGVISKIDSGRAAAFIPDENNTVTALLPLAKIIDEVNVGDNCVVAFFDADYVNFADGVIIAIY